MSWRRPRPGGLILPRDRRRLDTEAPLAQGLRSLWVPAIGLTPDGLQNLVSDDPALLGIGPASTVPALTATDFGPALSFDGVDDYLVKTTSAYQPPISFPATLAVVCRFDSIPASTSTLYSFCSANQSFTLELNVRAGRTRFVFTGDGNVTSTVVDIAANPTPGQVAFIVGALDSFSTARISLYEPATGVFLTASTAAGTTTNTAAANSLDYEVLGGWYGGGSPSSFVPVAVLDAWFWGRALADDELGDWRRDRWSVLAAPRRRTRAAPLIASSRATASQILPVPTNAATARATASAQQSVTLPVPSQFTSSVRIAFAQQDRQLPTPLQTATAKALARAVQGTAAPALTLDSGAVTLDSGSVTLDGAGVPGTSVALTLDSGAVTLDSGSVTLDAGGSIVAGLLLPVPTQTAHAQTLPSGLAANQALAVPSQSAVLAVRARAAAAQTLAVPAQAASLVAPGSAASNLAANQFLPLPTAVATAKASIAARAVQALPRPTQVATATINRVANASAAQTLPVPQQTAVAVPFVVPVTPGPTPPDVVIEAPVIPPVTGDLEDMIARQASVLPPWFGAPGTVPPVLRLPLSMAASVGSWLYDLIAYAKLQTRIRTATDGWLDLIAADFFGSRVRRRAGQGDEAFRRRILVEMFRPRVTREAMTAVLTDLTGYAPRIFEPSRPQDVGGIGIGGGMGVGVSGAIGSINLPGEVFIDAFRDPDFGIPFAAGIGTGAGGVGVPSRLVVSSLDQVTGALRDEDVYAAVEATRPVGVVAWVRISLGERPALPRITVPTPPV